MRYIALRQHHMLGSYISITFHQHTSAQHFHIHSICTRMLCPCLPLHPHTHASPAPPSVELSATSISAYWFNISISIICIYICIRIMATSHDFRYIRRISGSCQQQHLTLTGDRWGVLSTLSHGLATLDLAQGGAFVDSPF